MKRRLAELKILLVQEKRKAGVLALLGLVLIGMTGRAFWSMGPRTGQAATPESAEDMSSLARVGQVAVNRAIASGDAKHGRRSIEVPSSPRLSRNLFALDPAQFPPPTQPTATVSSEAVNPAGVVESGTKNADDDPRLLEMKLVEETNGWRLKSVVFGTRPLAVVETSGKSAGASRSVVLRVGQSLHEWNVVEITASTVVFEKNSVRVRLSSATPDR